MNIQRLKFAQARGARFEVNRGPSIEDRGKGKTTGEWVAVQHPSFNPYWGYRVAAKDQHLQYGPITTALIDQTIHYYEEWSTYNHPHSKAATALVLAHAHQGSLPLPMSDIEYRMYKLFVAEYYADEGL